MLGRHCIVECYDCSDEWLVDEAALESVLISAAYESGATVLHTHFHKFGGGNGVTGVIVLSESHISIHTWPEHKYMAVDVFMCGECDPKIAADHIINNINIGSFSIDTLNRGNIF